MKKILNVGIGGSSFTIDEDAYARLNSYLENFRREAQMGFSAKEMMEDLESRIAEIFRESLSSPQQVVALPLVERVIAQLGMPDGSQGSDYDYSYAGDASYQPIAKKLYRDADNRVIAGVCSGLSYYFNVDVVLVRVLMAVAFLFGSFGFWLYIILWIVVPSARSAIDKCNMHGIPPTAENFKKFYQSKKQF